MMEDWGAKKTRSVIRIFMQLGCRFSRSYMSEYPERLSVLGYQGAMDLFFNVGGLT